METHAHQTYEREERRRRQREANRRHREKLQRLRHEITPIYREFPNAETSKDAEKAVLCFRAMRDYLQTKSEKDKKLIFKHHLIFEYDYRQWETLNLFNERLLGWTNDDWEDALNNYETIIRRDHGEDWRIWEMMLMSRHYDELSRVIEKYAYYKIGHRRNLNYGREPNENEMRNRRVLIEYIN